MAVQRVRLADPLLTVDTVAHMLHVHHGTVRAWIRRGALPAVKINRQCVRIRAKALDEFLAARTSRRPTEASAS